MSDGREKWFPGVGGSARELYGWERCTHEGIGLPGCRVCDPVKSRVAERYEWLLLDIHDALHPSCSGGHARLADEARALRIEHDKRATDFEEMANLLKDAEERADLWLSLLAHATTTLERVLIEGKDSQPLSWALLVRLEEDVADFRRQMP